MLRLSIRPTKIQRICWWKWDVHPILWHKHKELSYLGTKSGKDEDKISNVNFHIEIVDGNPTFKEAKEVFICKKLYVGKLEKEHLLPEIYERNYPLDDLHYVYIGEITDVYTNK